MIKEEAKQWIKDLISTMKLETSGSFPDAPYEDEVYEALDEAVKALSQDSCEDAISRQAAIEVAKQYWYKPDIAGALEELPSVQQEPKIGHWINKSHKSGCGITFVVSECTCCGKKTFFDCDQLVYNYCPNCGSFMMEED